MWELPWRGRAAFSLVINQTYCCSHSVSIATLAPTPLNLITRSAPLLLRILIEHCPRECYYMAVVDLQTYHRNKSDLGLRHPYI